MQLYVVVQYLYLKLITKRNKLKKMMVSQVLLPNVCYSYQIQKKIQFLNQVIKTKTSCNTKEMWKREQKLILMLIVDDQLYKYLLIFIYMLTLISTNKQQHHYQISNGMKNVVCAILYSKLLCGINGNCKRRI